jgi:hypothetical protein
MKFHWSISTDGVKRGKSIWGGGDGSFCGLFLGLGSRTDEAGYKPTLLIERMPPGAGDFDHDRDGHATLSRFGVAKGDMTA